MTTQNIIKILNSYPILMCEYYHSLHVLTFGFIENANYQTKLGCLADSIRLHIYENTLQPQNVIDILDDIEEILITLDANEEKEFEINFFEDLLFTLNELDEDQPNYRYFGLFKDNMGPMSQRLCERNSPEWKKRTSNQLF